MVSDIASFILFIHRCGGLIFTPYKTMRKISIDTDWQDTLWIGIVSSLYFLFTTTVRSWFIGLLGALGLYIFSVVFLSFLPSTGKFLERAKRMGKTWAYTLLPTLIWFYSTLLFYFLVPPPRTTSLLGKSFSIFYIAFSASLLVWKLILVYFSIRFSLRVHLYRVIYYMLLYLTLSIPIWVFLYNTGISRIPFV